MVLWSLARCAWSLPIFQQASHWAVHVLGVDQQALSNRFARPGEDKFRDLPVGRSSTGIPLLEGCAARFECETAFRYEGGGHIIMVGTVKYFERGGDSAPLVFHGGRYSQLALAQ